MTIAGLCTASFSTLALVFALGHSGQSHGTVLDVFRRTFSTDLRALNRAEVARLFPPSPPYKCSIFPFTAIGD